MKDYIIYKTIKVRIPVVANTEDEAWEDAETNFNADPASYIDAIVSDSIECKGSAEPEYSELDT